MLLRIFAVISAASKDALVARYKIWRNWSRTKEQVYEQLMYEL